MILQDNFLSRLDAVQPAGGDQQWIAKCPAHDDRKNSLSVGIGTDGRILVTCHAGCATDDVLRSLSLKMTDLFPSTNGKHKSNGKANQRRIVARYPYTDEHGATLYEVVRFDPKDFRQRRPDGKGGWVWSIKDVRRVLYRLTRILGAPDKWTVVVEGEKDADLLNSLGFIATTNAGGAKKWLDEYADALAGRKVAIIPDNDDAGREHAEKIAHSLLGKAAAIKVIELPGLPLKGDVSDWFANAKTNDERQARKQELADLVAAAPEWAPDTQTAKPKKSPAGKLDPMEAARDFIAKRGTDSTSGQLTLRYWRDEFHLWTGRRYAPLPDPDLKARVVSHVDETCDKITRSVISNIIECMKAAALVDWDPGQPRWLGDPPHQRPYIAVDNGLLNLEGAIAGDPSCLRPHSPLWFSPVHLPYDYDPAADCPTWRRVIARSLASDHERIDLLQEWCGYCLTSDTDLQRFLMLFGEGGNGKSVFCALLTALLGAENVSNVPLELFGQRFMLNSTLGKLANIAAEIGDLDKVAEGHLKAFTSGDPMLFERKHKDPISAPPTARLVLATNNLPRFSDRSDGVWRRMLLVPFDVTIDEADRIPGLDKVAWWNASGELPGVFNWAMEGLRRLRAQGRFTESQACTKATEAYKLDCNPTRQFLLDNYCSGVFDVEGKDEIITASAYREYRDWCEANGYKPLGNGLFGKEIARVFPTARPCRPRYAGKRVRGYSGIRPKPDDGGF